MKKPNLGRLFDRVITPLLILEFGWLGYTLANLSQNDVRYSAGNGFPSAIVSSTPIKPKVYDTGLKEKLLFRIPEPSPELIEGLDKEMINLELGLMESYRNHLMSFCVSNGFAGIDETLSQEEQAGKVDAIFGELTDYYGERRKLPSIVWRLEEEEGWATGQYNPALRQVTLYNSPDPAISIDTLVHELSHVWIYDEALNNTATGEVLIRLAEKSGKQYLKDPSGTSAGRDACLYGLAAHYHLIEEWRGISLYLWKSEQADKNSPIYMMLMDYSLIPGLMTRYAAFDESVEVPVIKTSKSYSIDLSGSKQMLNELLLPEVDGNRIFPFY